MVQIFWMYLGISYINGWLGISTVNLAYMWEHAIQFGESNCFKKEIFMDFNLDSLVGRNVMQEIFMEKGAIV